MKALIFVYKNAKFQFTGKGALRQLKPSATLLGRSVEPRKAVSISLGNGVYAVNPNSLKEPHGVEAISGKPGEDYDLVETDPATPQRKDVWPDPKRSGLKAKVETEFSGLDPVQINHFVNDGDPLGE